MSRYIDLSKLNDSINEKGRTLLARTVDGVKYVYDGEMWTSLDKYVERELSKPIWDRNFAIEPEPKDSLVANQEKRLYDYEAEIKSLTEEVSYLKNQLHKAGDTNSSLYKEVNSLNLKIIELEKENAELKDDNKKLGAIDKIDFYMKYQYPEDSISPNINIRHIAQMVKEKYESGIGVVKFPEISINLEQHKDKTSDEMVETFRGIFEVWEKHPELNLSELMCKVFSKKSATMSDDEFVKILKEAYNG